MRKQSKGGIAVLGFIVLIIIGISNCGGNSALSGGAAPIASGPAAFGSPSALFGGSPSGAPGDAPSSPPVGSPTGPVSSPTTAPPQSSAPATVSSAPSGCYPRSNEGTCYEPGEYCRHSDHGASGIAGDGKQITCEDNDGWRWEPV